MINRSSFFVFVDTGEDKPIVAGFHQIDTNNNLGTFIYGRSYCENPKSFALDPINLPLIYEKEFHFPITRFNSSGIPGVLLDSGPDEWGKRIINHTSKVKPVSAADYLVMGSGLGVGALSFSDNSHTIDDQRDNIYKPINELYKSAIEFDANETYADNTIDFLIPSSGIGGARPKVHLSHNNRQTIAKFNRKDDVFDNTLAEYCMMQLAHQVGINTAKVELLETKQGNALLVERFDIQPAHRRHIISANALLNILSLDDLSNAGYDSIALTGKKISDNTNICTELFRRMLFNIAIGNTDDHTRNHAFLKDEIHHNYNLSPAYDLVPLPQRLGTHAINLGPFGQRTEIENIRACGRLMGLTQKNQIDIAESIITTIKDINSHLVDFGMKEEDIDYLKPCFAQAKLLEAL